MQSSTVQASSSEMPRLHWFSFRKSKSHNHDSRGFSTIINCRVAWPLFASWMIFRASSTKATSHPVLKVRSDHLVEASVEASVCMLPDSALCHVRTCTPPRCTALGREFHEGAGGPTTTLHGSAHGSGLPARLSVKCGGRHSSSVSDPPCSLLPLGAASNTVQHVASVPNPTVVCGVFGAGAPLSGWFLRNRDVGYSCLTDSSHIISRCCPTSVTCFCPIAGHLLSFMPTAGPRQRLLLMLSSLLFCLAVSSSHLCLPAGCLMLQTWPLP